MQSFDRDVLKNLILSEVLSCTLGYLSFENARRFVTICGREKIGG
jgi:hypothetical protein